MLIRIVKMGFEKSSVDSFLAFIADKAPQIRNFPGCLYLEVLQDTAAPNVLMTLSHWESAEALERYRQSALFKTVWAETKIHFSQKPEAWSLISVAKRA